MNKHERHLAGKKIAMRRAKSCEWVEPFDTLPKGTRIAFKTTGKIRISSIGDRKGFNKDKGRYGHFSGYNLQMGDKKFLSERAKKREMAKEIVDDSYQSRFNKK